MKICMIGLGAMGKSLALNLKDNGADISGYAKSEGTRSRVREEGIHVHETLAESAQWFGEEKRVYWLMVPDFAVQEVMENLNQYLRNEDILIEGGNSHYIDTEKRAAWAQERGVHFIGAGVSGGQQGARHGPCIMPGGHKQAWEELKETLEAIAAKTEDGTPCVAYMGTEGTGHFVKTIHNGIEYAIMQAITETYTALRHLCGMHPKEIGNLFAQWEQTHNLGGFLMRTASESLLAKDPRTQHPLVDVILDKAKQKGTGKWTAQIALDMGVAAPTLADAVNDRYMSARKELRQTAHTIFPKHTYVPVGQPEKLVTALQQGLYVAIMTAYAQGFNMLQAYEKHHIDLVTVASIWRAGCIIQSPLLTDIMRAFQTTTLTHLLLDKHINETIVHNLHGLRHAVCTMTSNGLPASVLGQTLSLIDELQSERLDGAALIQAMRDNFGSHTYERIDDKGSFHLRWESDKQEEKK